MPIHDRAYLRMDDRGERSRRPAFLSIAQYAAKYIRKSKLFWLFMLGAQVPALVVTIMIYVLAESKEFGQFFGVEDLTTLSPNDYRQLIKDRVLWFLQLQAYWLTFVAALAGGPAIAEDTRRHAFELYFSRPISAWSYVLGKWYFVFTRHLLVLLFPLLFVTAIAFGFLPDCFTLCWPVVFTAAGAAIFMSAAYAVVVLAVSSSVRSTRYAVIFWFLLAFVTLIAGVVLVQITRETRFEVASFRFTIEHVAAWILGARLPALPNVEPEERSLALSVGVLAAWLSGAGLLLLRRLRADARG